MFEHVPAEILRAALERLMLVCGDHRLPAYRKLKEVERVLRIICEYTEASDRKP